MDIDRVVFKVVDKLNECRTILDDAMYRGGILDMESYEFKKLRSIYDAICKAIDLT